MTQIKVKSALQAAIAHHQAGRYPEAEAIYRQILARFPQHPDALHMLGLLAHHVGRNDVAEDLIGQAIRLAPNHASGYSNLGNVMQAQGRLDAAISCYRRALAIQPKFAEAQLNLGNAVKAKGQLDDAIASYRRALAIKGDYAEAHLNLGNALVATGQSDEAARSIRRAIAIRPKYADAHNSLGNVLLGQGLHQEAIACYQRALALKPDYADAHNNIGLALQARGLPDEAIESIQRALAIRPDYADAHNNLGAQLEAKGLLDEAMSCYQRALVLQPQHPEAYNNLGNVLQAQGKLDEAVASYRQALAIRPGYADAHNNLGNALQALGLLDEAITSHDRALALQPDYPDAEWNKSFALLLKGDYAAGWAQFEWRWKAIEKHGALRSFSQPIWLGDAPVSGRTILLHHEQGLGDTLQMLRYAPLLAGQGARVIVEVPAVLSAIAASAPGVAAVVVAGDELPDYDLHCPMMSLPLALKTTLASVPAEVPYLSVAEGARARWRERLGPAARRRIGLVWSGSAAHRNDRNRSMPLQRLLPLLAVDAEFHSLQKEYRPADQAVMTADGRVRDWSVQLGDLADTAALIAALDLVICVDSVVAHLAGALGRPVWLLLPYAPDYRWMLKRTDSPWYPTMRLFRQQVSGAWEPVLDEVAAALAEPLRLNPAGR